MKIIYIECDAEEMRANRTVLDNVSEVFSSITRTLAGVDVTPEQVASALNARSDNDDDETEEESDE